MGTSAQVPAETREIVTVRDAAAQLLSVAAHGVTLF
jgi:hypothetical protein